MHKAVTRTPSHLTPEGMLPMRLAYFKYLLRMVDQQRIALCGMTYLYSLNSSNMRYELLCANHRTFPTLDEALRCSVTHLYINCPKCGHSLRVCLPD